MFNAQTKFGKQLSKNKSLPLQKDTLSPCPVLIFSNGHQVAIFSLRVKPLLQIAQLTSFSSCADVDDDLHAYTDYDDLFTDAHAKPDCGDITYMCWQTTRI